MVINKLQFKILLDRILKSQVIELCPLAIQSEIFWFSFTYIVTYPESEKYLKNI